MSALDDLNWNNIRAHYDNRVAAHKKLKSKSFQENRSGFVKLVLGISDPAGNYSAEDHNLGHLILSNNINAEKRVFDLSMKMTIVKNARDVPKIVRDSQIRYLAIGVGSEISCMMNPNICWVSNTRTIWTHLVIKHADDFSKANEELKLYRNADASSEMAYQIWTHVHNELAGSMTRISQEGERLAKLAEIFPGEIRYLWADAIATELYDCYHGA